MQNPLIVFDFDDTLVKSNAIIKIRHDDGRITVMSTDEFARYIVQSTDVLEFDESSILHDDIEVLPSFALLVDAIDAHGLEQIVILTARSEPSPPKQILGRLGIVGLRVVALGTPDLTAKARWISRKIAKDYHDVVYFYDDNIGHVDAVRQLVRKHPNVHINASVAVSEL